MRSRPTIVTFTIAAAVTALAGCGSSGHRAAASPAALGAGAVSAAQNTKPDALSLEASNKPAVDACYLVTSEI